MGKDSKEDRHVFDPYVKILGLKRFCLPASIMVVCVGVYLSIHCEDWGWLSRSGSLIAVFGLLLTMSPIFARGLYKAHSRASVMARLNLVEGATITTTPEDRKVGNRVATGIVVAILGAVINAFGDLIGPLTLETVKAAIQGTLVPYAG